LTLLTEGSVHDKTLRWILFVESQRAFKQDQPVSQRLAVYFIGLLAVTHLPDGFELMNWLFRYYAVK